VYDTGIQYLRLFKLDRRETNGWTMVGVKSRCTSVISDREMNNGKSTLKK